MIVITLCYFSAGKIQWNPRPNRDKKGKWYVSADMWPYKDYPLWFQGMVYMLSPNYTSDLYQAVLRTHYVFTDDVFIGICVNKTAAQTQNSIALTKISSSLNKLSPVNQTEQDWDEAIIPFFHLPDPHEYLDFFYTDFNELAKDRKIPAPAYFPIFYSKWL